MGFFLHSECILQTAFESISKSSSQCLIQMAAVGSVKLLFLWD
jgi:hypothetical protein